MTNKLIACCFLVISCFACEKDATSTNTKNIVGNWKLISAEPANDYLDCDFQGAITFESNHTLRDLDICEDIISSGTWTIQDNILTLANDELPIPFNLIISSLSSSKLTLKFMGAVEEYVKITDTELDEIEAKIGLNSSCQTCRTVSYENGHAIAWGTAAEYCGAALIAIKAIAPSTYGGVTTKWECN